MLFYLRGITWSLLLKLSKILGILFILLTLYVHSCFTSCIFAVQTLDFTVKFRSVFKYEAVVFRRYVLALLSAGLLQKFQAYLVYLSLIFNENPRPYSFFQKFHQFTYLLLWFCLIIRSFLAQIDDMCDRFSALSACSQMAYPASSWFLRRRNQLLAGYEWQHKVKLVMEELTSW